MVDDRFREQLGDPGHRPQVGTEEQWFMGRRGLKGQSPLNCTSLPHTAWMPGRLCQGWVWGGRPGGAGWGGPVFVLTSEPKLLLWCGHLPVRRGRPWVQGVHPCRSDPGEGGGLEGHLERTSPAPPPLPCVGRTSQGFSLTAPLGPGTASPAVPCPPAMSTGSGGGRGSQCLEQAWESVSPAGRSVHFSDPSSPRGWP